MKAFGRARNLSPSPTINKSPNGLFVSPAKSNHADSDEDLPSNVFGTKEKLAELIAQKRAERLAKEAEEKERKKNASSADPSSDLPDEAFEDSQEPVDPDVELIMSDASRPARKASKKALMEMERETQRMARQQALAHQMKVKKKFTTNDLFAKFNFRQPGGVAEVSNEQVTEGETTASSVPNSDGVEERPKEPASTPPSSPPTPLDRQRELADQGALSKLMPVRQDSIASLAEFDDDEDLPDLAEIMKASQKAKLTQPPQDDEANQDRKGLKLARFGKKAVRLDGDSDDELDIVQTLPSHLRGVFNKVATANRSGRPADSKAIHNLRHLSNMYSDYASNFKKGSKNFKPSISAKALEAKLRYKAKEQARKQQLERIEELKARGIEVQTSEERENEAEAFENLLEKARVEAMELRKAEKAARKGAGVEGAEVAVEVSDDEDEDFADDGSGSEGEEDGKEDEAGLIDEAAEETDDEDEGVEDTEDEAEEDEQAEASVQDEDEAVQQEPEEEEMARKEIDTPAPHARKSRVSRVILDDDDDEMDAELKDPIQDDEAVGPEEDPFAAFNFGSGGNADMLLSPTQAFNATMETPTQATQEGSFDILRRIAPPSASSVPPSLPDIDTPSEAETQQSFVAGSQVPESQRIQLNWETQAPETPGPAKLRRDVSGLAETPGWEPTQDPGLPSPWSVKATSRSTFDSSEEQDTQSTVRMRVSESPAPSQTAPKRGRLVRRQALADDSEDEEAAALALSSVKSEKKDAFREMARKRKEALTEAERAEANKEMRDMMDEAAEESDDEYAGLGGDDFVAPETEQDKEMIDSSHVEVNEREIAAHFAERERIRNEEETSRLYKDLTTGVLRRKMGANAFDLEEDEDELAMRRRQMRQQEEARKRKALLKDVNVASLVEGRGSKGKDAFLKAIADDDVDEEVVNISDDEAGDSSIPATQDESQASESQQAQAGPLRETSGNKRRSPEDHHEAGERPPAKQRRTQTSAFKRPTSLLEVQESVSFLLDGPHAGATFGPTALELSSDSENDDTRPDQPVGNEDDDDDLIAEEEARQNDGGFAPNPAAMDAKAMPPPRLPASQRRTAPKPAVVDRLSLKRVSSASESAHGRTAWASGPTTGGFKVPSLLRRATTNTAFGTTSERGVTTPNLSRENSGSGVKMGGSKKSSLAYQARAEERKAIVEASAKRREENTRRIAQLRRNSSALNRGLTGRFE